MKIITSFDLVEGNVLDGDLLLFNGGAPRYPGDRCVLTGGYPAVIEEHNGELYYRIKTLPRHPSDEERQMYAQYYDAMYNEMLARTTLWQRFLRWWREEFMHTHHRGCGGRWEFAGTSGLMVMRLHYRCARCHREIYELMGH